MQEMILGVVMDGAQARLFERSNPMTPLHQIRILTHTHEATHEHGPDRPGRTFEGSNTAHHAYEPRTDWHEHQKEDFVEEISALTLTLHKEKNYTTIFLVSPPKIQGALRASLTPLIEALPASERPQLIEVHKDLTHHRLEEIDSYLKEVEK